MMASIEGGLYGALSIRAPGEQRPDHEFVVYLSSHLGFMTIDGRAFVGNTPVFHSRVGDLVQWDVLAIGDDFHTFHVHGHRWLAAGRDAARHAGRRAGGELQDPLARGHAGDVAVPLPRREPHDERDDRDLPGEPAMRRVVVPLALALLAVAAPVASGSGAEAPTRAVTMPGKAYDPSHLDVLVGTTVTWKNDDSINHTVTADGDAFSSGYLPPGGSFSFTFAQQGHYAFHCTIHKFMQRRGRRLRAGPDRPRGCGGGGRQGRLRGARTGGHRQRRAARAARGHRREAPSRRELRGAHGDRRARELPGGRGRARQPGSPDPRDAHRSRRCLGRHGSVRRSRRDGRVRRRCSRRTTASTSRGRWSRAARSTARRASSCVSLMGSGALASSSSAPVGGPTASRSRSCCAAAARRRLWARGGLDRARAPTILARR